MTKSLTTFLNQKGIIFKDFNPVNPKDLGSRKKINIFDATGVDKGYYAIFLIDSKSRFLQKNVDELEMLFAKMVEKSGHNYKYKMAVIQSPLCSKAKEKLLKNSWRVEIDFM